MDFHLEFVALTMKESASISALYRQFGISQKSGYVWIRRSKSEDKKAD